MERQRLRLAPVILLRVGPALLIAVATAIVFPLTRAYTHLLITTAHRLHVDYHGITRWRRSLYDAAFSVVFLLTTFSLLGLVGELL